MSEHVIRTARKARGWSASRLSEDSGVAVATIYAIEQGRSVGSVRTMLAVAASLNLAPGELIDFAYTRYPRDE